MWRMPYVTVSYIAVQGARKAGMKGVGKPEKAQKIWNRFSELKGQTGR